MAVSAAETRLEEVAQELFDVLTRLGLGGPRRRRGGADLKEAEFLTLALLQRRATLTVGEIQRRLGVLPAQMSRILRGLEGRDKPLVTCRINPRDKRKVNVVLTAAGARALRGYQAAHVRRLSGLLGHLPSEDVDDLRRLLGSVRDRLTPRRQASADGAEAED